MSSRPSSARTALAWALALAAFPLPAADLLVTVSGVQSEEGDVSCALFSSSAGFPMDAPKAAIQRQKAARGAVQFQFKNVTAGTYAVAASHDRNGNQKTDKNFIGIPAEAWGVSNGVRPKMRAPKFQEAAFTLKEGEINKIEIQVSR